MLTQSTDPTFETFPTLNTERLDLVEIRKEHLGDIFKLFGNEKVTTFYNVVTLTEESQAQKLIDLFTNRFKEKAGIRWGICIKGTKGIIGTIGFNNYSRKHKSTIGYDLLPQYWNQGFTTEALKAVIDFGFNHLDANRIEAEVMQGNIASERVLQKLGFKKEGVLREWKYWNNRYHDMSMFSLLRSDTLL